MAIMNERKKNIFGTELLKRMMAYSNDVEPYDITLAKMPWHKVAFGRHSAEECQQMWNEIQLKLRTFRSLHELLKTAKSRNPHKTSNKLRNMRQLGFPVRPENAFMKYLRQRRIELKQTNPSMKPVEITKVVSTEYASLSSDRMRKMRQECIREMEQWKQKTQQFLEQNPQLAPPVARSDLTDLCQKVNSAKPVEYADQLPLMRQAERSIYQYLDHVKYYKTHVDADFKPKLNAVHKCLLTLRNALPPSRHGDQIVEALAFCEQNYKSSNSSITQNNEEMASATDNDDDDEDDVVAAEEEDDREKPIVDQQWPVLSLQNGHAGDSDTPASPEKSTTSTTTTTTAADTFSQLPSSAQSSVTQQRGKQPSAKAGGGRKRKPPQPSPPHSTTSATATTTASTVTSAIATTTASTTSADTASTSSVVAVPTKKGLANGVKKSTTARPSSSIPPSATAPATATASLTDTGPSSAVSTLAATAPPPPPPAAAAELCNGKQKRKRKRQQQPVCDTNDSQDGQLPSGMDKRAKLTVTADLGHSQPHDSASQNLTVNTSMDASVLGSTDPQLAPFIIGGFQLFFAKLARTLDAGLSDKKKAKLARRAWRELTDQKRTRYVVKFKRRTEAAAQDSGL